MVQFLSWLCMPIFIDYERIQRKSKGIKGYIKSIQFYHNCFVNACKMYGGIFKTVKIYTMKV